VRVGIDVILFHNASPTLLEVMPLFPRLRHLLDRFGATGSLLCAVHCAVLPVLLAAAPSLGLSVWMSDGVELALVCFVTLLGLFSLVWGYRRHGALRALGFLVPGLVAAAVWPAAPFSGSARRGDDPRRGAGGGGAPGEPAAEPRPHP